MSSRALLPDTVNFAYTPKDFLRVNADEKPKDTKRARSPDFSAFALHKKLDAPADDDEHVLLLEFSDNVRGKKQSGYVKPVTALKEPPI
jgi:DEAD/DEAH box helicase domain-containing protein